MPKNGAYTLAEAPPVIEIECRACARLGRYNRDRQIAKYGPDFSLPAFKAAMVGPRCSRARNTTFGACSARFSESTIRATHEREVSRET